MSVDLRPHALEPPPGPAPSGRRASTAPTAAAAGALALGAALLLWATRDLTYLMDEWDLIQYRWPATLDAFFMLERPGARLLSVDHTPPGPPPGTPVSLSTDADRCQAGPRPR